MSAALHALDDTETDAALVAAAFALAGEVGWMRVSVAEAARRAGVKLVRARQRFGGVRSMLARFGRIADVASMAGVPEASAAPDAAETPRPGPRDLLFDILMRRIDVLQAHRQGMLALLRVLPFNPPLAAMLAGSSLRSMQWMLEAAGVDATGPRGLLRAEGLLAVWLWTVRAWKGDESEDLSATMSALDKALDRAEQAEMWLGRRGAPMATEVDATMAEDDAVPVQKMLTADLPRSAPPPPSDAPASPPA